MSEEIAPREQDRTMLDASASTAVQVADGGEQPAEGGLVDQFAAEEMEDAEQDEPEGEMEGQETMFSGPGRYVPPEMVLLQNEEDWAWDLVQLVEGSPMREGGLHPLTDFEYAVYALVTKGNREEALRRIRGIQQFRELYNVQDTVEEGMTVLEEFLRLQPRALLCVDSIGTGCVGVMAWNFGAFIPAQAMATEGNWRIHALCKYYLARICQPTLQAVRDGLCYLADGSMSWENLDEMYERRMHDELSMHDPVNYKHMLIYNTNSVASVAFGLLKPLMTAEMKQVLELGCQIELNSSADPNTVTARLALQDIYLQPSYEAAMDKLLQKARELLELHFNHHENYQL